MISRQFLIEFLKNNSIAAYRAKQIFHAIYRGGKKSYRLIKTLPEDLKILLEKNIPIFSFSVEKETVSEDSVKTLFRMNDGKFAEGVLMRFKDGRNSVCVSSQVGCGLKCAFCATGAMGFTRNLKFEEIADQVLYFDQMLKKKNEKVSHVVFMGMGEPMLNYNEVMKAIRVINDPECLGLAARHITVSTSGIVPGIKRLIDEDIQINLAVSLHAPNQSLREKLMPIAKSYSLKELMTVIKEYIQKTRRRVSYEYVMLNNINDSIDLAEELALLIKGQMCHVNLIPYNETYLGFKNSGKIRIAAFEKNLKTHNVPVTVRVSLGQNINAACGQLALKTK